MTARVVAIEVPIMRGKLRGGSLKNWESVDMLSKLRSMNYLFDLEINCYLMVEFEAHKRCLHSAGDQGATRRGTSSSDWCGRILDLD